MNLWKAKKGGELARRTRPQDHAIVSGRGLGIRVRPHWKARESVARPWKSEKRLPIRAVLTHLDVSVGDRRSAPSAGGSRGDGECLSAIRFGEFEFDPSRRAIFGIWQGDTLTHVAVHQGSPVKMART